MPRPPPEAQTGHPRNYRSRFHTGNSGGEGGYSDSEREFMVALDRWKREHRQPFPTVSEVLGVLVALGYKKDETACPTPCSSSTASSAQPALPLPPGSAT